ncbi:DUF861 domain-containing protein [Marinobacter halodurans]|uniref:DUF861 domain-containing protein n=1 Tax=Marinobacter halodurans TaxID=2528979 RepID=A0ABY1ZSU1_9GAMM|nr:cupin domain-containing protein [Marinobacter halodurans]TBW59530.1 DUF861 domain-containing protein [Marinobacter halodurans]
MKSVAKNVTINDLDAWGSVADLGSEILEGKGEAFGKMTFGAPTDPVSSAYFGVSKSKFRMTYPFNEHAVVISGEVELTDENTGETTVYRAGDVWFAEKGTPVLWDVKTDNFIKHYLAVS